MKTPCKAHVYRIKPENFSPQVEVAACYVSYNDHYLLLHRAAGKPQEFTWGIPAGKLEAGETPHEAVVRETREETGIFLDENRLKYLGPLYVRYPHLDFIYHMFTQEFLTAPEVQLSNEHKEYRWVEREDVFSMPLISGGREAFHQFLSLSNLPKLPRKGFYFIRHGETDVNANPHLKRVDYDLPLNKKGKEQAVEARKVVRDLPIKKVHSSPIERAQQTKEIVLEGLEIEQKDDERLSECKADVWTKMVKLEGEDDYNFCPTVESFLSRTLQGASSAIEDDKPTLIVAHGGIHWAICYHLSIENHPWKIGNCEVVHFEPVEQAGWRAKIVL